MIVTSTRCFWTISVVSQCFWFMTTSSLDLTLFLGDQKCRSQSLFSTGAHALAAMADVSSLCMRNVRGWGNGISYRSVMLNSWCWVLIMLAQFFVVP